MKQELKDKWIAEIQSWENLSKEELHEEQIETMNKVIDGRVAWWYSPEHNEWMVMTNEINPNLNDNRRMDYLFVGHTEALVIQEDPIHNLDICKVTHRISLFYADSTYLKKLITAEEKDKLVELLTDNRVPEIPESEEPATTGPRQWPKEPTIITGQVTSKDDVIIIDFGNLRSFMLTPIAKINPTINKDPEDTVNEKCGLNDCLSSHEDVEEEPKPLPQKVKTSKYLIIYSSGRKTVTELTNAEYEKLKASVLQGKGWFQLIRRTNNTVVHNELINLNKVESIKAQIAANASAKGVLHAGSPAGLSAQAANAAANMVGNLSSSIGDINIGLPKLEGDILHETIKKGLASRTGKLFGK